MSRIALACVLCLLIAGCTAPTAPTGTPTPAADASEADSDAPDASATTTGTALSTDADATGDTDSADQSTAASIDIAVSGGSLPVEHERIFARTTDLLGASVAPPSVLVVRSPAEIRDETGGSGTAADASDRAARTFAGVMGIGRDGDGAQGGDAGGSDGAGEDETDRSGTDGDDAGVSVAAYTPSAYSVVVNERVATEDRAALLERTLAHEFVHSVQFRRDAFDRMQAAFDADSRATRDTLLTYVGVVEGAAAFVAAAYDRRYLAGDWASVTATERYRSAPSGVKYRIARYYFGRRYFDSRFDSPRNLSAVYDDPPTTTEQLLHYGSSPADRSAGEDRQRAADRPKPLALTVAPGENRTLGPTNVNGELFTRIALGTELNESRAAEAAAGWGADRLVPVADDRAGEDRHRNRSFVWATRWDSPDEADEFAAALGAHLDSRAERVDSAGIDPPSVGRWRDGALAFRTVRASSETVVLLAGTGSFVWSASVSGTNASASVSAGGR